MELAATALGSLLRKLGSLLTDEYKLQKRVRGEIRFLKAEMESMQAALEEGSKLPAHQIDGVHKIWARDLKELVYDIEDSVDTFMVRIDIPVHDEQHSFKSFFDRTIRLLTKVKRRHHFIDDIQDIKGRIREVSDRRQKFKFEGTAGQPDNNPIDPRVLAIFEHAENLVGTDGPAEKISNLLTKGEDWPNKKLMVVSIVGAGGLGKTTIANLVYERLGDQFDCKAFVPVSLKPDMEHILSKILRQVSEDKCAYVGEKDTVELIRSIKEFLADKRYLIVIDDLWNTQAWKTIEPALIKNVGSRVIVTTRNMDVAKFCSVDGEVHELDPLSDEDSRRLLCKRVFNEEDGIYFELEEVTTKILKKCGGIPLAIITIASMLASMPNRTKYEWYGVYNSLGSGLEKHKTLDNMRNILHLSYSDMPSYLKPCLLYLSLFPEDYDIPRNDLVRLWVAEGFVDENQSTNLYDLGEMYFNELVNRSMIQPIYFNEVGVAKACRVHDMILDLIISISTQENFAIIAEGLRLKSTVRKIRRMSLQGEVDGIRENNKEEQMLLPATVNISHARSLIVFGSAVQLMPPLSRFSVLRVLSLKNLPSKIIHPKDLGRLHHLRYLELGDEVEPRHLEGIGNLNLLKTLALRGPLVFRRPPSIKELPTTIVQLQGLEHLLIDRNTGWKLPDGIGNLTSLQELSVLSVHKSPNTLAELGKLTELRMLTIIVFDKNESHMKTFLESLSNLRNLRTLEFIGNIGFHGDSMSLDSMSLDSMSDPWRGPAYLQSFNGDDLTFSALPRWFSSLSELTCLSIRVKVLRQVDLQLLGALPVLRFLKLHVHIDFYTTVERLVIGGDRSFRSLAEFNHRSRCWLVFGPGAMPKLQKLELYFEARKSREGGGIDVGLENLTSLKHVTVEVDCSAARAKEVEDVETRIWNAIYSHPNHPTLQLSRSYEIFMKWDENNDVREASQQQRVLESNSSLGSGSSSLPQSPSSAATDPESVNDSQPVIEIKDDEPEEQDADVGSKRKLTSAVWKEFKRVKMLGKVEAKCMYCGKKLSAKSKSGTKHLHDHLKACPYRKRNLSGKDKNLAQTSLRFASKESGQLSVENYTFDPEVARKELAAMIILHEYPLSMVDHTGFRRFVTALQPLFKLVTRNTIRKDIMDTYKEEKKKALEYMAAAKSRVAITTDMWTSENQKRGYMAVTAHFIDDSWTLRNIIMRFIYVPAPHTAAVISEELYEALVEWNIDEKISTVTMDNCSTNDAVIPELVRKIGQGKLMLDGKILHMRCCAHILNLIVRDGLDVIQPAIAKIRDSIAFWTATPKRVEKFEEIAKYVKVSSENKLGLDCKTRWNSTYKMLNAALPYESAFNRATRVEKLYDCAPSKEDWAFAREVVGRLKMFDDITALFSGTNYVTANVQLFKICEAKTKIKKWSACGIPIIEQMSTKMIEKFDKYWMDIQGPMGIATILDPRFKTDYLLGFFECLFGQSCEDCGHKVEDVKASLCDLMKEYQLDDEEDNTESSAPSLADSGFLSTISARVASRKGPMCARFKTELDRYLDDDYVPVQSDNFKILDWWNVAGMRYPTLRKIARDIFAIPVSTVASESAFSTSGRVLSEHRSRLTPEILEALMCCQDWMRRKYIDSTNVNKPGSFWSCLQEIQEGLQELVL